MVEEVEIITLRVRMSRPSIARRDDLRVMCSVRLQRVRELGVLRAVLEQEDVAGFAVHRDCVLPIRGRHLVVVATHAAWEVVMTDVVWVGFPIGVHVREYGLAVGLGSELRTLRNQILAKASLRQALPWLRQRFLVYL